MAADPLPPVPARLSRADVLLLQELAREGQDAGCLELCEMALEGDEDALEDLRQQLVQRREQEVEDRRTIIRNQSRPRTKFEIECLDLLRALTGVKRITLFLNCSRCGQEMPEGEVFANFAQLEIGITPTSLQIWCQRHDSEVASFTPDQLADFIANPTPPWQGP